MSGLFEKDFRLLKQQKGVFVLYLLLAVVCSFAMTGTFAVMYLTLVGGLLAIGTIKYDEHDNGFCYLMVLPIDAKTYAIQKHLFSTALLLLFWVLGVVVQIACNVVRGIPVQFLENIGVYAVFLPVLLLVYSGMLPLKLKFGSEKSGAIIVALMAAVYSVGVVIFYLAEADVKALITAIGACPFPALVMGVILVTTAVYAVSVMCSIRIMKRKEY